MNSKGYQGGSPFGQHARLTVLLKKLVHDYPKGIGIIKELLQNADDANATKIHFVLDKNSYPAGSFPFSPPDKIMGPSLLVYNDQTFSQDDLERIQSIGESGKLLDGSKTGRFGLGFNTCYNITDYPCLLTKDSFCGFDPHQDLMSIDQTPGRQWKLKELWEEIPEMLEPFQAFGIRRNQEAFQGTIFRLPLRSEEQAKVSEIKKEAFTYEDFEAISEELKEIGTELLLFLKNVTTIEISEINPDSPNKIESLLSIHTENHEEVQSHRKVLNNFVDKSHDILDQLRSSAPKCTYFHEITLKSQGSTRKQKWYVVNGFFVDSEQEILKIANEMLEEEEKALPWVGIAACVEDKVKPLRKSDFQGKLFCFLPLPEEISLPVHINGYFDLDSSRHGPIYEKGLRGKDAHRVLWNQLLVKHALAPAYATLIEFLVEQIGDENPKQFYRFWPDVANNQPGVLEELPKLVYQELASRQVIRTASDERWKTIGETNPLPLGWKKLEEPLSLEGVPIPQPAPPTSILESFKNAEIEYSELTPAAVRSQLKVDYDLNCSLDSVTRPSLKKKEWVADLLKFCLKDQSYCCLQGLPLALLDDKKLHTFGHLGRAIYLAEKEEKNIFSSFPEWFVDSKFAKESGLSEDHSIKLHQMTPEVVLQNLDKVLSSSKDENPKNWNPNSEKGPNQSWLRLVYRYFNSKNYDGFTPKKDILQSLPIVPCQFDQLYQMGGANTPLFKTKDISSNLSKALTALKIPLVTGSKSLIDEIRKFSTEFPDNIWEVTVRDLIDTMDYFQESWKQNYTIYDSKVHDPVLDFFAKDENIQELKDHDDRLEKMIKLPLFPTQSGEIVSLDQEGLYLASEKLPPFVNSKVRFLDSGKKNQWKRLLKVLGIKELNSLLQVRQIILPKYDAMDNEEKFEALSWIRDFLENSRDKTETDDTLDALREDLKEYSLILCSDGEYRMVSEVYNPKDEVIKAVLGENANYLDERRYSKDWERWLEFLRMLDLSENPQPQHILDYVDSLLDRVEEEGIASNETPLRKITDYIHKNWEELSDELTEPLQERSWLLAERDSEKLEKFGSYRIPESDLFTPSELFHPKYGYLVASQVPVAELKMNSGFYESLESPKPDLKDVVSHFDQLLDQWHTQEPFKIQEADLNETLKRIYSYIGKLADDSSTLSSNEPSQRQENRDYIHNHYQDIPCLWDEQSKSFWIPSHVFRSGVAFTKRRVRVINEDTTQEKAYDLLGRLEAPEIEDYIGILKDLKKEYKDDPLSEEDYEEAVDTLKRLEIELHEKKEKRSNIPVLTETMRLVSSNEVFEYDTPWLDGTLDRDQLYLLHKDFGKGLIEHTGIQKLSKVIEEKPVEMTGDASDLVQEMIEGWEDTIWSSEFQTALRRLIIHSEGVNREGDLNWLQKVRIEVKQQIKTRLKLDESKEVGFGETDCFYDHDQNVFYLKEQNSKIMERSLAKTLNGEIEELQSDDLSLLTLIITALPKELDSLLTGMKIPPLSEETELDDVLWDDEDESEEEISTMDKTEPFEPLYQEKPQPSQQKQRSGKYFSRSSSNSSSKQEIVEENKNMENNEEGRENRNIREVDDRPPMTPGHGQPSGSLTRRSYSQNDSQPSAARSGNRGRGTAKQDSQPRKRMVSYITTGKSQSEGKEKTFEKIDSVLSEAIQAVKENEEKLGKTYEIVEGHSHYHLVSNIENEESSYILVRGIETAWRSLGVPLSKTQYEFAQKQKGRFWLYIVEYAQDPDRRQIHRIQNPMAQITEYRFDHGWKSIAERVDDKIIDPVEGVGILANDRKGVILEVKKAGKLQRRIKVQFNNGEIESMFYRASKMKLFSIEKN